MKTIKILFLTLILTLISQQLSVYAQDSVKVSEQKANEILTKYIDAIGGKEAVAKVEDRTTIMRGTAMGQTITLISKQKAPNKMRQEVKAGGMEQVIIFNGKKGVMNVMNQKIEIKDKELEALNLEADMNFMSDPAAFGVKLSYEGIEKVDGKDAYKVKMELPSGLKWYALFDTESGLKVQEQREIQTPQGSGTQTITYGDYKDVNGVKYPFKITQAFGGQSVDVTVSSIKVNKGLSDDLFIIAE